MPGGYDDLAHPFYRFVACLGWRLPSTEQLPSTYEFVPGCPRTGRTGRCTSTPAQQVRAVVAGRAGNGRAFSEVPGFEAPALLYGGPDRPWAAIAGCAPHCGTWPGWGCCSRPAAGSSPTRRSSAPSTFGGSRPEPGPSCTATRPGRPRQDGSLNLLRWYSRRLARSVPVRRADEKYHGPFGKKEFQLSRTGRGVTARAGAGGRAGRKDRPNRGAVVAVSRVCGAPAGWVFIP
jgi:hypothetical protein